MHFPRSVDVSTVNFGSSSFHWLCTFLEVCTVYRAWLTDYLTVWSQTKVFALYLIVSKHSLCHWLIGLIYRLVLLHATSTIRSLYNSQRCFNWTEKITLDALRCLLIRAALRLEPHKCYLKLLGQFTGQFGAKVYDVIMCWEWGWQNEPRSKYTMIAAIRTHTRTRSMKIVLITQNMWQPEGAPCSRESKHSLERHLHYS